MSTPAKIRTAAVAAVAVACCLAAVLAVALGALGGQFHTMGGLDESAVDAATGLYYSVNDMDAQVGNVLLVGNDRALAADNKVDIATYDSDLATANSELTQTMAIEADNPVVQRQLRSALDGLGQFQALSADALLADKQTQSPVGMDPANAAAYYQQATDLMQTTILPVVSSLTNVSAARLDATYTAGRSTAGTATVETIAVGAALLVILVGLQLYLSRRFRRRVSPALAAATLVALALSITGWTRLSAESGNMYLAKVEAFDSVIALTQARATSFDANADETRFVVLPARAAQYQQAFLTKSQEITYVGNNVGIFHYDAALAAKIDAYDRNHSVPVPFGGDLGAEFDNITFPGERAAATATLLAYQVYERDDRILRKLVKTNLPAAVAYDIGTSPGQSDWAFNNYIAALNSVININTTYFARAAKAGQSEAANWNFAFPAAGAALIALLVLVGVRPRLAEYR
ncbi:MAG: hypothetical protein ABSA02_19785 [Trebonia sp.]|jgi:hypothetical protein